MAGIFGVYREALEWVDVDIMEFPVDHSIDGIYDYNK